MSTEGELPAPAGYLQKPPHRGLLEHKTSASFDGVHREPVDLTAALVVSRGIRYEPIVNNETVHPFWCWCDDCKERE